MVYLTNTCIMFLYLIFYYTLFLGHVAANNFETQTNQFLDYVSQVTKTLGFLNNIEHTSPDISKNITDLKGTGINDIDSTFSIDNIQSLLSQDNKGDILNTLKDINKQLWYKFENGVNRKFKANELKNINSDGNLEEFARQLIDEGRKVKTKKLLMKVLVGFKVLTVGVILPIVIGTALFASWKGVTISLMALLLAGIISLKNLVAGKHDTPQHVVVAPLPSQHQHWWRKTEGPEVISWDSSHELAYSGHR